MSKVKDKLIETTESIVSYYNLKDDNYEEVQEIIFNNELLTKSIQDIINFFKNIICPHCLSFLGKNCSCITKERL